MKVGSVENLVERLDDEVSWRKREISEIALTVEILRSPEARGAVLRAGLALLYAHFEGYVRESIYLYLSFVTTTRTPVAALSHQVAPFFLRSFRFEATRSGHDLNIGEFVALVRGDQGGTKRLSVRREDVDTQSNLNWKRLLRLLSAAGLDTGSLPDYEGIVDEALLARRNGIAHGQWEGVSLDEYTAVRDAVLKLMDAITTCIVNAAASQSFKREGGELRVPDLGSV